MKIFEVSDVAVQDPSAERRSRNYRRLCAVYMDRKAGFEVTHGLLDRVMQIFGVPFLQQASSEADYGYFISSADGEAMLIRFLKCRRDTDCALRDSRPYVLASDPTPQTTSDGPLSTLAENLKAALPISKGSDARDMIIGSLGVLHPSVLSNFDLTRPCSALEIDVEPLL